MTMKSFLPPFHRPNNGTTSWIVAGLCAAAVATGLTVADADLSSLQRDRSLVASEVTAHVVTLHDLNAANAALSEKLVESRGRVATHEQSLSSRSGFLP